MNDQTKTTFHDMSTSPPKPGSALDRLVAQGSALADPKAYVAHAAAMLAQVREALIKAESLHLAKRSTEIVAFKDRLQKMDAEQEKTVAEYTALIEKLEAFRG
jgi:hypothetical protein